MFAGPNDVWITPDRRTKLSYNQGTGLLSVIVGGTSVLALSTSGLQAPTDSAIDLGSTSAAYANVYADAVKAISTNNLALNTISDDRQVRINSRSFTQATGDSMAFQAKPSQTVTTTGSVQGGQISPRLQDAIAAANLIGLHVDTDLKGTTGNISGAIKGLELELVSDVGRTSTVTGDVSGATFRSNMAMTISGDCTPLKVFNAEAAGGAWDALFKLEGTQAGSWNADPTTELDLPGGTVKGYIKVLIGAAVRYIALYEAGNLAD